MSTNIKYDYYVSYLSYEKYEIVIISTRHPHASVPKFTKNHLKYVFIHKISFKSEIFLSVDHETSHMDLHSLKIQLKVEHFTKSDFSVCQKKSDFSSLSTFSTKNITLILFKYILT